MSIERAALMVTGPNPSGLCQCGCGQATSVAAQSSTAHGRVAGEHTRFVPGHYQRTVHNGMTHGRVSTYSQGCRCDACRQARRIWAQARWYADHEANKAKGRDSHARHRAERLDGKLFAAYGITRKEWNALLENQSGACAACGCVPEKTLQVDHDHATGKIRGLLCGACNLALGMLNDSVTRIDNLAKYLRSQEV